LGSDQIVSWIRIYNRADGFYTERLSNALVTLLDGQDKIVLLYRIGDTTNISTIDITSSDLFPKSTNSELAKAAMKMCDQSMSLLAGSTTSLGTLRDIATLVNKNGPMHMPGECCMDSATSSQFFGYRVRINTEIALYRDCCTISC
jgi:hypothetical protein